jgi:serine/threonine-protein kinase
LGSKYMLHDQLGRGAMGQVFRGTVRATGAQVAVKILKPELVSNTEVVARFFQERAILTAISDPHVVEVIDLVGEGETLGIVMELVEGQDLRHYLRKRRVLAPAEAVGLIRQILHGLVAVHAAGIVHRDVKPENVLMDISGAQANVKITDFGVARLSYGGSLTKLSSLIGTPEYMAPELADHDRATPAADIYSTGIMLYEMLAGQTPFAGGHPLAVLRRHVEQAPSVIPGVPPQLWAQIAAMLIKDPRRRPTSAAQVAERLGSLEPLLTALPELPYITQSAPPTVAPAAGPAAASTVTPSATPFGSDESIFPREPQSRTVLRHRDRAYPQTEGASSVAAAPARKSAAAGSRPSGWLRRRPTSAATPPAPKDLAGQVAGDWAVGGALTSAADTRSTAYQVRDGRPAPTMAYPESGADAQPPRERRPRHNRRRPAAIAVGIALAVVALVTAFVITSAPPHARHSASSQRADSGRPTASAKPTANATAPATRPHTGWVARTGGPVESRPAVVGGTVYFGSRDHKVYALDATTGHPRWAYTTGDAIRSSPTVVGGTVYIGSSDHKVYALDATTGHPRWTYTTGGKVNSSPTVVGGTVYIGGSDHKVYALDATTGHPRWTYTTGSFIFTRPAVADGTVYVGSWDHKVYALDATTGHPRWTYTTGAQIFSSPAVADGTVYIGSRDAHVYALDAATGHLRWAYSARGPVPATPAVADGTVYVDSKDGRVYALDAATGHLRWAHTTRTKNASSSPVVAGSTVYVGSSDHKIYAFDATTGHRRWAYTAGDGSLQMLAVADGTIYIGSTDHSLYAVSVGSGQGG